VKKCNSLSSNFVLVKTQWLYLFFNPLSTQSFKGAQDWGLGIPDFCQGFLFAKY